MGLSFDLPKQSNMLLQEKHLNDQTNLIQIFGADQQEFYGLTSTLDDISWGPLARIVVELQSDMDQMNRKTESMLDLLGVCGGLLRALTVIGSYIVSSYNQHALSSFLTKSLVRFVPSQSKTDFAQNKNERRR